MIYKKDGIEITGELHIGEANYPLNWWANPALRDEHGVTEEPEPVQPAPTLDEILFRAKAELTDAIQRHLDLTARTHGYDNIVSACSYAGAPNPYQAEGAAFIVWRGAVWQRGFELYGEVMAGARPIPTEPELIALLPVFEL